CAPWRGATEGWRIRVGDDAHGLDEAMRADPEGAYGEDGLSLPIMTGYSAQPMVDEHHPVELSPTQPRARAGRGHGPGAGGNRTSRSDHSAGRWPPPPAVQRRRSTHPTPGAVPPR